MATRKTTTGGKTAARPKKVTPAKAPRAKKAGGAKPTRAASPKPVKTAAPKPSTGPEVSEIVAAALVGAAAALRDPSKARQLAATVGEEIEAAARGAAGQGAAIWQLAMDVAKRSVDALGAVAKGDKKDKKKKKKKAKRAAKK